MHDNLRYAKTFIFVMLFISLCVLSNAEAKSDAEFTKGYLANKNYDLISFRVVQTGDIVSSVKKNILSGEHYVEYSRPALIKVKATCKPTGKIYESTIEITQYKDKWGNWTFGDFPMSTGMALNDAFPKDNCKTKEQIKAKQEAEAVYDRELAERAYNKPYIPYKNGTVLDTRTGLMWASKALYERQVGGNVGYETTWDAAKEIAENYKGGGYTDWRLPTLEELSSLYDRNNNKYNNNMTDYIQIEGGRPWASDRKGEAAACFRFYEGKYRFDSLDAGLGKTVLPVRVERREIESHP